MNRYRWLHLLSITLALLLPCTSHAQWYQGPSGGSGGSSFDLYNVSGKLSNIQEVIIYYDTVIRCIKTVYAVSEPPALPSAPASPGCHLSPNQYKEARFRLDPDEFIVGVAGRYGTYVDSIRFYTNKKNSPVYGGSGGVAEFGYTASPGQKIGAFIGRSGANLDAIGVLYVQAR